MRKLLFKSSLLILLIFYAKISYSLSNQEVRNAIQDWIKTQEYPQDMDEITLMIATNVTTRGILYSYQLKLRQDDLEDFRQVFQSIKSAALDALCNNSAMLWYKNNKVEMTYEYYDEDDNIITIFKIHSSSCSK
tara:strand:- start:457 stop:858 length:402 start_codon:yes stop_codon:yes gene_type:complete